LKQQLNDKKHKVPKHVAIKQAGSMPWICLLLQSVTSW